MWRTRLGEEGPQHPREVELLRSPYSPCKAQWEQAIKQKRTSTWLQLARPAAGSAQSLALCCSCPGLILAPGGKSLHRKNFGRYLGVQQT